MAEFCPVYGKEVEEKFTIITSGGDVAMEILEIEPLLDGTFVPVTKGGCQVKEVAEETSRGENPLEGEGFPVICSECLARCV